MNNETDQNSDDWRFLRRVHFTGSVLADYPLYWYLDNYGCYNAFIPHKGELGPDDELSLAWISKRPGYCDRGAYQASCDYSGLDGADGLPKYGMHLFALMYDMDQWIQWRFEQRKSPLDPVFNPPTVAYEDINKVLGGEETDPQIVKDTLKEIYRQHQKR